MHMPTAKLWIFWCFFNCVSWAIRKAVILIIEHNFRYSIVSLIMAAPELTVLIWQPTSMRTTRTLYSSKQKLTTSFLADTSMVSLDGLLITNGCFLVTRCHHKLNKKMDLLYSMEKTTRLITSKYCWQHQFYDWAHGHFFIKNTWCKRFQES